MPVTLKQIALQAGVSTGTASRVLSGKHKEAYGPAVRRAARIREVAARLGFVPNASARAMQRSSTQLIGLLVPESPLTSLVDYETIVGINAGLENEGYVLALTRSSELKHALVAPEPSSVRMRPARLRTASLVTHPSRVFRERMVDGMVVLGLVSPAMSALVARVAPACLWVDTNVDEPRNCLRRDELHAGRLAASQLAALGYRRLVFVSPVYDDGMPHYSLADRLRGVVEVAGGAGIPVRELRVSMSDPGSLAATLDPLLSRDTAVIASSDHTATALLAQLAGSRRRIGVDFGLASCDRTEFIRRHWPGLSCVDARREQFGRQAARMMVAILRSPQHVCATETVHWDWHPGDTAPPVPLR